MLIAAALIELTVQGDGSLKARRRVANAVKQRIRNRFEISVAEVGDPEAHREVVLGCVMVGIDPTAMRKRMENVVRFVEGLGLAEVLADDVTVARLDELTELEPGPESGAE